MIRIDSIDHPALIKLGDKWYFAVGTTADFVLDYPSYDPTYFPGRGSFTFRDGLDVVSPADGERYLAALAEGVVSVDEIDSVLKEYGPDRTRPQFLIDFDNASFTSSFFDQALEDEVGAGWTGSYSDPMAAAPPHLQAIWPPFPA